MWLECFVCEELLLERVGTRNGCVHRQETLTSWSCLFSVEGWKRLSDRDGGKDGPSLRQRLRWGLVTSLIQPEAERRMGMSLGYSRGWGIVIFLGRCPRKGMVTFIGQSRVQGMVTFLGRSPRKGMVTSIGQNRKRGVWKFRRQSRGERLEFLFAKAGVMDGIGRFVFRRLRSITPISCICDFNTSIICQFQPITLQRIPSNDVFHLY